MQAAEVEKVVEPETGCLPSYSLKLPMTMTGQGGEAAKFPMKVEV